jgi:hypothetical protein
VRVTTEVIVLLRFVKLLAVCALVSGTIGAYAPRALDDRKRAAYLLAAPGLAAAWGTGLAMALGTHLSPVAPWIAGAAIASTIAINVVLWSVAKDGRRSWLAASTSVAGLVIAVALMVFRPVLP